MTNAVDLILNLAPIQAALLARLFPDKDFYCPPEEVIVMESRRESRGHFNLIHHESGHRADVYLIGEDPLREWGLERRRQIALSEGHSVWVAPPEYVIIRKLEYFRESESRKHVHDIQGMLSVSGDLINEQVLRAWLKRLDLEGVWERVTSA